MIITDFAILGLGAPFLAVLPLLAKALGTGFTVHFISQARVTGAIGLRESLVTSVNKDTGSFVRSGAPSIINGLLIK